jgi:hypothetical protein
MPLKKAPVWEHFAKFEGDGYKETPAGEIKTRTKALWNNSITTWPPPWKGLARAVAAST